MIDIDIKNTTYKEDLELMELIPRDAYMEIYGLIKKNMWKYCTIPTVGDIVDFMEGIENENFDDITEFLGNREKLEKSLQREDAMYSNEESEVFIDKVISSNVTDISESGWFYKKLMASTDDVYITEDDCGSIGVSYKPEDIDEAMYDFKIRFSHVNELGRPAIEPYSEFIQNIGGFDFIHVRTPSRCHLAKQRKLCRTCCGVVKKAQEDYYTPKNFGVFSTLMITEHATQASLDSMNKGTSENVNIILDRKMGKRNMTWEEALEEIDNIIETIGDVGVQARFYDVALISRLHESNGRYTASSFQYSITHQQDALGAFIFSPTERNFIKLVNKGEFEADSIKTQIMFDKYE